jgi:predicted LPLAT superfamily acyltransferase
MSRPPSSDGSAAGWDTRKERGGLAWIRFIVWGIRAIGYRGLHLAVAPTALYFTLAGGEARCASRAYLARLRAFTGDPTPPSWLDTYRHIHSFAEGILDRLSLWSGAIDEFEFMIHGREHLEKPFAEGRGAFLVGAHIGSFDMLRGIALDNKIPVNVIMHSANAERINRAFERLAPDANIRVITADPHSPRIGFEVNSCLSRGEFVATLADRVPTRAEARVRSANFLGHRASFPEGPFLLPMVLRVPLVLTIAIRTGPRRYDVYFEPIADGESVPKSQRDAALTERVELFASRLEHYCAEAPLQWFNFYDFWGEVDSAGDSNEDRP